MSSIIKQIFTKIEKNIFEYDKIHLARDEAVSHLFPVSTITKFTSQAMWGVDCQGCQEGWSWTKKMYRNHWEIDKTKFFSVKASSLIKVSHKFINNYIFRVHNSFLLILSNHLSLDVLSIF